MNPFIIRTTLLTLVLLFTSIPATAVEVDSSKTSNIGFVLYTQSEAPGTLNARWMFGDRYRGPGLATGGPREGFAGTFHVRYFFENGEFSDEYDLEIIEAGDLYQAHWRVDGVLKATGVGMEVENGLAIGWRRVDD